MARKTADDFHPEALKLFDQYVHGDISRRDFLSSVPKYALLGLSAEALLEALNPRFAEAKQIADNDPRVKTRYLEIPSPHGNGKVRGLLAEPANAKGKLPLVLVIHENRGLNPHIEDIARRLAVDNFIAFAPDALYTLGGYPGDEDKARELFQKLDKTKTQNDFLAAAQALKKLPEGNGKLGAVGFCYGGGIVNFLATRLPDLAAGVPFYGAQPPAEEAAKIKAPLLIHYAGVDDRINAGWPAYEAALQKAGVNYEAHTYPGVQHGFNNDTTPRYDAATAKLAWDRTIAFFNAYLRDS
ncbi:dienelactone hydrolase family protein [Methylomonas koyamae]|uniref:Carboxymethylenebutenolidase n=1 Tax=Methylomonas koyamae TaxID=702114 RepID=A0A291IHS4_9GAMM|nr:dienelactone hydrolase family protein [Methylomonas koyamae]ATG89893.1 carboxymethylenebutenolidase [Methylomonas koyamae]OAI29947.1 carboxymethylenebutenolidase [Methylomonas koyamae]WNB74383.1 dienelactone hydrolase family protein [Methylomonas koyamae]